MGNASASSKGLIKPFASPSPGAPNTSAFPDRFTTMVGLPGSYPGDASDLSALTGKQIRLLDRRTRHGMGRRLRKYVCLHAGARDLRDARSHGRSGKCARAGSSGPYGRDRPSTREGTPSGVRSEEAVEW